MNLKEKDHQAVYAAIGSGTGGPGFGGPGGGEGYAPRPNMAFGGIDGMAGPGGVNQFEEDPKGYRMDVVRKRLRYQLYCVQTGFGHPLDKAGTPPNPANRKGVQRLAAVPAERKVAEELLASVNKLVDIVEKNKIDLIDLDAKMRAEAKSLEIAISKAVPAAPVEAAAPAPGPQAAPGTPAAKPAATSDDDLLGGAAPAKK